LSLADLPARALGIANLERVERTVNWSTAMLSRLFKVRGFQDHAASGRFQAFDWDGNLVWEFEYHSEKRLPHHDAIKLPNGNVLAICWE
jgi:hypothetical protein